MPILEYRCEHCHAETELLISIQEERVSPPRCLECGEVLTREIRTAPHFKFKGSKGVDNPTSFKSGKKQDTIIPINFIDEQPDGTVRVSSTQPDKLELIED